MRAERVGFLLCRLVAVGMVVLYLPDVLRAVVSYNNAWGRSEIEMRRLGFLPGLVMLCAAVAIWAMARGASRRLFGGEDVGGELSVDGAQFAAIGLALIGVAALVYSAGDLVPVLTHVLSPYFQHRTFLNMLFASGDSNAPTMAILGLLLLAFAPRLGIWLEQAALPKEVSTDESS